MQTYKYAGNKHELRIRFRINLQESMKVTYTTSTTMTTSIESRMPRPKNTGPTVPEPNLMNISNAIENLFRRNTRQNIGISSKPNKKDLV